jgi:hypothetical protein
MELLQPSPFIPNYRVSNDQTATNVSVQQTLISENIVNEDLINLQTTGVISGGQLQLNSDSSKINILSGVGIVVDNSDGSSPKSKKITWTSFAGVSVDFLSTDDYTFIGIDINKNIIQQTTMFTNIQRRSIIILGLVVHLDSNTVQQVVSTPYLVSNVRAEIEDLVVSLGSIINSFGNDYSSVSNNLQMKKTVGEMFLIGINSVNTTDNPSTLSTPFQSPVTIWYTVRDGSGEWNLQSPTLNINPNKYDDGSGTLQNTPAGEYTVQRIYFSPINLRTFIEYGQQTFSTPAAAEDSVTSQDFQNDPSIEQISLLRCFLIVQQGTTDLSTSIFIQTSKFGTADGGGGGGGGTNLQNTYDLSSQPQIVLSSALQLEDSTPSIGNLLQVLDNTGSSIVTISSSGLTATGTSVLSGVTIAAHASRHQPGGADPIPTAAPITDLSSTSTNSTGTATTLARSDHSHAIDFSSFSVDDLSGTLSVSKGGTGATTLTSGNFLTGNGTSTVLTSKIVPTGDVIGTTDTQTLTNKTLTLPTISSINNSGTLTLPIGPDVLVARTSTDTLTNKTLTSPVISTIVNTGILTLPTSTDTLVGRATTDTLTNKTLTLPTITSINNGGTLTLPTGPDTLVARTSTDTLTNKTLTSPHISTIINAGTLTLPTSTDTLVGRNTTDTLTNKTLTLPTISSINNGGTLTLPTGPDTLVARTSTDTLTNKTLTSPVISTIVNTGTLTLPTSTDTLVGRNTTDILTNKTLTAPVISTIVNTGTLTLPTSTDTLVGRATTDTLTNKTLTAPIISTIVNTGTLTLPTSTDTLVGRGTTDILTNKTITDSSNVVYASGLLTTVDPVIINTLNSPTMTGQALVTQGSITTARWASLYNYIYYAFKTNSQTIPTGTWTPITGYTATGQDPSSMVQGLFLVFITVTWNNDSNAGSRYVRVGVNNTTYFTIEDPQAVMANFHSMSFTNLIPCNQGDSLTFEVKQTSGGNISINGAVDTGIGIFFGFMRAIPTWISYT